MDVVLEHQSRLKEFREETNRAFPCLFQGGVYTPILLLWGGGKDMSKFQFQLGL